MFDRVRQNFIVARQAVELGAGFRIETVEALLGDRRRHAVRLGKDDVEADGERAELGEAGHEVGHRGARPRPLPDRLEAVLVDIDNDDRVPALHARAQHLKEIERPQPQFLKRARIGQPQRDEREQQYETNCARHPELARPAG